MNIAALLNISFNRVEDMLMNALHEQGFNDIRPVHGKILGYINREDGSQLIELAQRAKVTKQFMSQLAQQIEEMGYIRKIAHHFDKRSQIAILTPKGKRLLKVADKAFKQIESDIKKKLTPENYKVLVQCLEQIITLSN